MKNRRFLTSADASAPPGLMFVACTLRWPQQCHCFSLLSTEQKELVRKTILSPAFSLISDFVFNYNSPRDRLAVIARPRFLTRCFSPQFFKKEVPGNAAVAYLIEVYTPSTISFAPGPTPAAC